MSTLDLGPPAQQVSRLLEGITDDQMSAKTPCENYSVGDLLDHFMGLTLEFRNAATKATMSADSATGDRAPDAPPPAPSAAHLDPEWRTRLPAQLHELAAAWKDPDAWEGMTRAGGVLLPAEVAALVAVDELVLHGWDVARGTGQKFDPDPASTQACFEFTTQAAAPGQEAARQGLFGPVIEVPDDAPLLHRALGLSGRDPAWTP